MAVPHRVAVTGLGVVAPSGIDARQMFGRLVDGESFIQLHTIDQPPRPVTQPAIHCAGFSPEAHIGKALASTTDRSVQMALTACFEAWRDAGLPRDKEGRHDYGVSWGSALGSTSTWERGYREMWQNGRDRLPPLAVVLGMSNAAASHISIQLGLGNSSLTYVAACASAAAAIGEGYKRIRNGEARLMVTGGSDVPLAYAVMKAWDALRVVAQGDADTAPSSCRPFHPGRSGLVLGEGAATLILEEWEHARARGATILAEVVGYGTCSDHSHLVRPDRDGQVRAMRLALEDAGLTPDDVDYINAHGTATIEGDAIEVDSLRALFGDRAAQLPVSATKSMHGHLMGAAGAIEAVTTVLALAEDALPPTAHLDTIDPACEGVRHITGGALRGTDARVALSNSFAFGGCNAVLAFRKADPA
ncbi:MAG: beta-ketoacyl-[acyl-carrier-protein] synthase family protein [Zoogloea sp.]|uniref:beta-ketoacyl-[acyl-carrier-protein] synthase family protein n=1 Tax=Zoogloea sp. TaxID=49181 RepID=UPI002633FDCD|nr:beta-ketoacyl-[acyl-carrier-protein] synthase family protein [Zoogloea sp.]MDD2987814.1 beta-ketoacyl-[acyl-carrier-protein] synthase family protein [Zoogloea sp.]